jgi:polysaccharide pyruvyl transferase CsaB
LKGPLILMAGAYGHGNVGDDAIGLAMCRLLREAAPDVRIVLLGGNPARLRLATEQEGRYLSWRSPLRTAKLLTLVRSADAVLIGGGGLLSDRLHFYRPYVLLALAAELLGKPVMFYAVGAYPPSTLLYRLLTRLALGRAAAVTARDQFSARSIRAAGVRRPVKVTADPAITLSPPAEAGTEADQDSRPLIGISMRPMHHDPLLRLTTPELVTKLAACLDAIVDRTNARLLFIPMHFGKPDDDGLFDDLVVHAMTRPVPVEMAAYQRPDDVLAAFRRCDIMLGMRLHANILGAAAGTPGLALASGPKIREFMHQLGHEDRVVDLQSLEPADVAARVAALLDNREQASLELRQRVEPLRAKARACALMAARLAGCPEAAIESDPVALEARS